MFMKNMKWLKRGLVITLALAVAIGVISRGGNTSLKASDGDGAVEAAQSAGQSTVEMTVSAKEKEDFAVKVNKSGNFSVKFSTSKKYGTKTANWTITSNKNVSVKVTSVSRREKNDKYTYTVKYKVTGKRAGSDLKLGVYYKNKKVANITGSVKGSSAQVMTASAPATVEEPVAEAVETAAADAVTEEVAVEQADVEVVAEEAADAATVAETEETVAEEPAAEEAVAEEPVAEEAVAEEPVAEVVTDEPAAEAVAEESATEAEVEEPAAEAETEEPAVEETVAEEPAAEDAVEDVTEEDEAEPAAEDEAAEEETTEVEAIDEETAEEEPAEEEEVAEEVERSVTIYVVGGNDKPVYYGDTVTLKAKMVGYDDVKYTVQWQYSTDDENWHDVSGATSESMTLVISEENAAYYWRMNVEIAE